MTINKCGIALKPLVVEDIALFEKWLNKNYIYKRLCPDEESAPKCLFHNDYTTYPEHKHIVDICIPVKPL